MKRSTLTIVLTGSPYGTERAAQALRIAEAALDRNHHVNLFASSDGTYAAVSGQAEKRLPNVGQELGALIERGLRVELCGSCLRFRGLGADRLLDDAHPSTLSGLGAMLREADAVINL